MDDQTTIRRSERAAALIAVLVIHAALLGLLVAGWSATHPKPPKSGTLSVVSLLEQVAPPAKPIPAKDLVELLVDLQLPAPQPVSTEPHLAALASPRGGCATLGVVGKALVADAAAVAAVVNSPLETRSIAEAIILWNAGWSSAAYSLEAPLGPARAALERSLADIPEECLDEHIAGPRLVPIPAGGGTMFLVIGSGVWHWRQLSESPALLPAEDRDRVGTLR